MIGYGVYKSGDGAEGAVMIVPFILVVLGAAWVVYANIDPEAAARILGGLEEAVMPYWPGWPVTLVLLAAIQPGRGTLLEKPPGGERRQERVQRQG